MYRESPISNVEVVYDGLHLLESTHIYNNVDQSMKEYFS